MDGILAIAANSGNYMRTSALKKHYCRKRSLARKAVYENFRFMKSLTGGICKLQY